MSSKTEFRARLIIIISALAIIITVFISLPGMEGDNLQCTSPIVQKRILEALNENPEGLLEGAFELVNIEPYFNSAEVNVRDTEPDVECSANILEENGNIKPIVFHYTHKSFGRYELGVREIEDLPSPTKDTENTNI